MVLDPGWLQQRHGMLVLDLIHQRVRDTGQIQHHVPFGAVVLLPSERTDYGRAQLRTTVQVYPQMIAGRGMINFRRMIQGRGSEDSVIRLR